MSCTRKIVGFLVALAYWWKRCRTLRRMRGGWRLPVVFHALPADAFGRILDWFAARGVVDRLWVTFDDGWLSVKDYLPHLRRHGLKAKLFIAPGETLRGSVWTDVAIRSGIPAATWRSWYGLSENDRYERLGAAGCRTNVGEAFLPPSGGVKRTLLTKEDVIALARTGLVEIENHTWSHLSATLRPTDEVMDEIVRAQSELTAWTGRAPTHLAWPFGRGAAELDARVRALGLEPVYTRNLPEGRTMALEGVTLQENLGRLLGAWPKVGETL